MTLEDYIFTHNEIPPTLDYRLGELMRNNFRNGISFVLESPIYNPDEPNIELVTCKTNVSKSWTNIHWELFITIGDEPMKIFKFSIIQYPDVKGVKLAMVDTVKHCILAYAGKQGKRFKQ